MKATEERVSHLEANMEDVTKAITRLETSLANLDQKMDKRFDAAEERFERRFLWMMGTQLAILLALVGGMFGIITKLIPAR